VAPQRTDLVLTTDIPHGELNVLVLDGLDVKSWIGGLALRLGIRARAAHVLCARSMVGGGGGD
jgi:hypothetical protein